MEQIVHEWSQEDYEIYAQWERELASSEPFKAALANHAILTVDDGHMTPSEYEVWCEDNYIRD